MKINLIFRKKNEQKKTLRKRKVKYVQPHVFHYDINLIKEAKYRLCIGLLHGI